MLRRWSICLVFILATILSACAPAATPSGGESAPATTGEASSESAPVAGEPKAGGSLTYGQLGDISTLDPFQLLAVSYAVHRNLYDSLIQYDNKLNIVPMLAESWEANEEGTQITLNLRQGVKWHNGRDFVADDVVQNFERAMSDTTGYNVYAMVNGVVESAEALDDHTVVVNFVAPTPQMFDILNAMHMHAPESFSELDRNAIGTGPFKFQEWIPGDHITLVRNDEYWQEGKPYLDQWTFKPYADYESLVAALQGGVIDVASGIQAKDYEFLTGEGLNLVTGQEGFLLYTITVNPPDPDQEQGPLSDKRVRCAINYALDRETVVEQALYGAGKRLVTNFPEWSVAYFPEFDDRYPFDLDMARQLLAEAGYPDGGFTLRAIMPSSDPSYESVAVIHQADLAELGIDMEIQVLDSTTYTAVRFGSEENGNSGDYDLDYTGVGRQHLDPTGLFSNSSYRTQNSPVFPQGDFPEGYVDLVTRAGQTTDVEERRELYRQINEIQLEECINLPYSWRYIYFGTQTDVHGLAYDVEDKVIFTDVWLDR